MEERLQKIMSHAGLGSRRACEELILNGRVTVNGRIAEIGQKADPAVDRIVADGRVISAAEPPVYIAIYKPRNVLSAVEAEPNDFRKTVRSLIPLEGHIYPVGRLDFDSEGLVLMTNDGELTNKLTHPRFGHFKIYRVLVARRPDNEQLATWRRGVVLEDGYKTAPADVSLEASAGKGAWLRVVMREGRKRQIREIGSLLGMPVVRILRIGIGTLRLGNLKPGDWRHLTEQEVAELQGEAAPTHEERPVRRQGQSQHDRRPGSGNSGSRSERPVRPGGQMQRDRRSDSGDSGSRSERPARSSGGYRSGDSDSRSERPARPTGGPSKYKRRPDSGNSDTRSERPSGGYRSGSGDSDSRSERPARPGGGPSKYKRRPDSGEAGSRSERPSGGYRSGSGDSDSRSDRPARPGGGAPQRTRRPSPGDTGSRPGHPARKSHQGKSRPSKSNPKNRSGK
ncbi:MAG: rRNA pseudouridine synthase [Anaerolineae bacterium]|nr:rRNA pseudouridine synthase [Anaerolineae bacterium]